MGGRFAKTSFEARRPWCARRPWRCVSDGRSRPLPLPLPDCHVTYLLVFAQQRPPFDCRQCQRGTRASVVIAGNHLERPEARSGIAGNLRGALLPTKWIAGNASARWWASRGIAGNQSRRPTGSPRIAGNLRREHGALPRLPAMLGTCTGLLRDCRQCSARHVGRQRLPAIFGGLDQPPCDCRRCVGGGRPSNAALGNLAKR